MIVFYIIVLIIILLFFILPREHISVVGVCGKEYMVSKKFENVQDASNTFCYINTKCKNLIEYLTNLKGISAEDKEKIEKLREEYDWDDLIEGNETYNINKGQRIYICLRDPATSKIYDMNLLMFVVIHELSHIITNGWDTGESHSKNFWENNVWLLRHAATAGVYIPVNYSKFPVKYCGMVIRSNPLNIY